MIDLIINCVNYFCSVTSLINAAHQGDIDLLRRLLAEGHTVNESNFDSVTALHEACLAGQVETVEFLLQQGANVSSSIFIKYQLVSKSL